MELPQVRRAGCHSIHALIKTFRVQITLRAVFTDLSSPFFFFFFPTCRAGFARQGTKEKQLLKQGNAFNVSPFVLRAMMSGQYWPEGDEVYHAELTVPILLIHGMCDKFVPMDEDQRMAEVRKQNIKHENLSFTVDANQQCFFYFFISRSSSLPFLKSSRRGVTWS